jgi:hypothetical protein
MHDIDWGAVFSNIAQAAPAVASAYFGSEAIKAQAEAQTALAAQGRAAPGYGLPIPSYISTSPQYSPVYGVRPTQPTSGIDTTTMLIIGAVGLGLVFLLMSTGK